MVSTLIPDCIPQSISVLSPDARIPMDALCRSAIHHDSASDHKYVVIYARITEEEAIDLSGVFCGGFGDTMDEAEGLARDCVNTVRGGTIIPRVVRIEGEYRLVDAMFDATERFEGQVTEMQEMERILNRRR